MPSMHARVRRAFARPSHSLAFFALRPAKLPHRQQAPSHKEVVRSQGTDGVARELMHFVGGQGIESGDGPENVVCNGYFHTRILPF